MADESLDWHGFLGLLDRAGELTALLEEPDDEQMRQETHRFMLMSLSQIYPIVFHSDPDRPDLVPFLNATFTSMGPNPDNVYYLSAMGGEGVYRVSGDRGSVHLCGLNLSASSGPGMGMWMEDAPGPNVGQTDLDALEIESDGTFELIVSPEKPQGCGPNWLQLDPRTQFFLVRQISYDWLSEVDARIAVERLDAPAPRPRPPAEAIERSLRLAAGYVCNGTRYWLEFMKKLRDERRINTLSTTHQWDSGGIIAQVYYDGVWHIADDEALVIESEVPDRCRYWNLQLADPLFCGIDMINRQTSLNGFQARLDADGKFRAVLSHGDPGVPNWLDAGGYRKGSMVGRWLESDSAPQPEVRVVPLSDVRDLLPDDTPEVAPEERDAALRVRRRAAQLRRRW